MKLPKILPLETSNFQVFSRCPETPNLNLSDTVVGQCVSPESSALGGAH